MAHSQSIHLDHISWGMFGDKLGSHYFGPKENCGVMSLAYTEGHLKSIYMKLTNYIYCESGDENFIYHMSLMVPNLRP